jgi:hypothetical protein
LAAHCANVHHRKIPVPSNREPVRRLAIVIGAHPHFAWAVWKDARLDGIEATHAGQFAMQSTIFNAKEIQINARTSRAGMVECEVRQSGQPVKGLSFDDSVPFSGDAICAPCRWRDADVAGLRRKQIEIRFRLPSATIFACKFV